MRRAVRDYRFEVNESRMTEECVQYLTQVQKDWERHRVKLGVEAIKKEVSKLFHRHFTPIRQCLLPQISERDRDRESVSSFANDSPSIHSSIVPSDVSALQSIDVLFDRAFDKSLWEPASPPRALGELLDSRFMIPLAFPSDPRLLAALPGKQTPASDGKWASAHTNTHSDRVLNNGTPYLSLSWRSRNRKIRDIGVQLLRWVDGTNSAAKWGRSLPHEYEREDDGNKPVIPDPWNVHQNEGSDADIQADTHEFQATPLTRRPSGRAKARYSISDINSIGQPIDHTA